MADNNRESIRDDDQYWRAHGTHIAARPDAIAAGDAPEFVNPRSPAPTPNSKNPSEMDLQTDKLVQELLQRVSGGETQHEDDIPGRTSALARVQSLDSQTCSAEEAMLAVNALLECVPTDFEFNSDMAADMATLRVAGAEVPTPVRAAVANVLRPEHGDSAASGV